MYQPTDDRRSQIEADLDGVMKLSIPEVAKELVDSLGARLTAAIGGAQEARRAREWSTGANCQRPDNLRTALQVARAIAATSSMETAKAWFVGCSSMLEFTAPLVVLDENSSEARTKVLRAAVGFARK